MSNNWIFPEVRAKIEALKKHQRLGIFVTSRGWLLVSMITVVFYSCSNAKTNSFTDKGVIINGVKWATRNVDKPGTFATKVEDAGMFYQWNRKIGWSATDPSINSNGGIIPWDSSTPEGDCWAKANDPSPIGWHVPTLDEIQSLTARSAEQALPVTIGAECLMKNTRQALISFSSSAAGQDGALTVAASVNQFVACQIR